MSKLSSQDSNETERIRSLVRQFVRSPENHSNQVSIYDELALSTGYRMPISAQNPFKDNDRAKLYSRIREEWSHTEATFKEQASAKEDYMQCRSIRQPMTGRYEYYELSTNHRIPSKEYERRYRMYAAECRIQQRQSIAMAEGVDCTDSESNSSNYSERKSEEAMEIERDEEKTVMLEEENSKNIITVRIYPYVTVDNTTVSPVCCLKRQRSD